MPKSPASTRINVSQPLDENLHNSQSRDFNVCTIVEKTGITARERAVIECLCADMTVKIIACHLSISEYTIQDHIKNIKRKLGVHTANGLVARAMREQVV